MKIKTLLCSDQMKSVGLTFSEMRNLGQVVALFGKNGSGKSRLLTQAENEITDTLNALRIEYLHVKKFDTNKQMPESMRDLKQSQYDSSMVEINKYKNLIDFTDEEVNNARHPVIKITGGESKIIPHDDMLDSEYRQGTLNLINNPSFGEVKANCAKFIKSICKSEIGKQYAGGNKSFYANQPIRQERNSSIYKLLQDIIKTVMHKNLDFYVDEHLVPIITLNDRPIFTGELSHGEKELLAYCTFLVLQSQDKILNKSLSLKDKILMIDELELFLHPEAQIQLISGLRELVGEHGQIWLATHSLAILSVLDRDEIWLMENGNIVSPSIETPNKVLNSLVGEKNLDRLENFVSSQYEWASIQFALECLSSPNVVTHKEKDPQLNQVNQKLNNPGTELKILDFGAGKGRLAQEILRNPELAKKIYYQSLEVNKELHLNLKHLSEELQKNSLVEQEYVREVLDSHEKLNEKRYIGFFDRVLMVNVLHEIPLNKWQSTLNNVLNSLKPDGKIILLEDQAIPRGENAHEYGFLILDVEELKLLFDLKNEPNRQVHNDEKYKKRLTCVEIEKTGKTVTSDTIEQALKRKRTNCKLRILELRAKKAKKASDGRENSFLTQLYANVDMALEDLPKTK